MHSGGALPSLPCVRGGAAQRAAEGLYLTETIFFLSCKLQTFTIPQALSRQLPLHKGAFWFVRTLQADLRGVMRLWRCAPAPYRVCANIAGDLLPQGVAVTMHRLLGENLTP